MAYRVRKNHPEHINLSEFQEVVSLGTCCEPTFNIRNKHLSKQKRSYPFDWLAFYSVQDIIRLLSNDFDRFTDTKMNPNPFFPRNQVSGAYYNFTVPHHTSQEFKEKYTRKVQSLRNLFQTDSKVLFILKCHFYTPCTPDMAHELVSILHRNAPRLSVTLLLITEHSELPNEEKNWFESHTNIPYPGYPIPDLSLFPSECFVYQLIGPLNQKLGSIIPCFQPDGFSCLE